MPEDSYLRIKSIVDTSGLKAGMAESRAIVAQQLGELKVQYASATLAAKAAINDLKAAEVGLGKFAAAGSAEAVTALEGYRQKVAETAAEQVRLGGVLEQTKRAFREASVAATGAAGAMNAAGAGARQAGAGFAAARVEVGAFTATLRALERGIARLAFSSSALGPLMREALPIAIALGFEEIIGRLVTHFRDLSDELTDLKELRDTQNQVAEASHKQFLELVRSREENAKIAAQGLEGQAKLNSEIRGTAPILHDISAEHQKAIREVTGWEEVVRGLQLAYDQAGGILNGFNTLRKRDMDEAAKRLKEEQGYVHELESAYQSLATKTHAAHAEIPVEAEKQSLRTRMEGLESLGKFEHDNYEMALADIRAGAEEVRRDRDNQIAAAEAVFDRKGAIAASIGKTETDIANRVLQETLAANKAELDAEMDRQEAIKRLALEKGKNGANVKPEIDQATAAELHAQVERGQRDMAAWDAAYKTWAKDAKESGEAVTRVLAEVNRAQLEDMRRGMEEAKKNLEERIRLVKEDGKTEIDSAKAVLDEKLRHMNEDREMSIGKAHAEIALVNATAAEELAVKRREIEQLDRKSVV